MQVRYLRELFAETVTITVDNAEVDGKDLILTQRIINKRNKECVTAVITFRFVDGAKKRSISVPEDFFNAALKAL
jgi:acyl-CoA thioesterase FadM